VVFAAAAVLGIAVFGELAWRSVAVARMDAGGALRNFEEALARVPSTPPLVQRDGSGHFVRHPAEPISSRAATELHALAYFIEGHRLVRADAPLWFFKVKGPAARYALRDTVERCARRIDVRDHDLGRTAPGDRIGLQDQPAVLLMDRAGHRHGLAGGLNCSGADRLAILPDEEQQRGATCPILDV
jgi:hypothetical protein